MKRIFSKQHVQFGSIVYLRFALDPESEREILFFLLYFIEYLSKYSLLYTKRKDIQFP